MEPASSRAEDEHLDWLKSVLHQVDGLAGTVLQAHLVEGQTLKDLAQAMNAAVHPCAFISMRAFNCCSNGPSALV